MPPAYWLGLAATRCAIRLGWLLADPAPMLVLGDSWTYLASAHTGFIPLERSWVYGRVIVRAVAINSGSLLALVVVQAACSIAAAMLMAWILDREFGASVATTLAVPIAWISLEPTALLLERYLMADAIALFFFAAFVAAALAYLRTRKWPWLLAVHAFGLAEIMLRYAYVPIAWVGVITLPLLACLPAVASATGSRRETLVRAAGHLVVSIAVAASMHAVYKSYYGRLVNLPAAYNYEDGFFMIAALAPLVTRADFPDERTANVVLAPSKCELGNRHMRVEQRWHDGCIVSRVKEAAGPGLAGNQLAKSIGTSVLLRDPLGVAHLTLLSWADWFNRDLLQKTLREDRGERGLPPEALQVLRERFHVDARSWPFVKTPTNQWYLASGPWMMFLIASPLYFWAIVVASPRETRVAAAWLVVLLLAIVGLCLVASVQPGPRYLHPVAWLVVLGFGGAIRGMREIRRKGS